MPESRSTRNAILAVALELFREQGYDATSLRQISERLGLTKAALYYHFPAKEHLVVELTKPFLDAIANLVTFSRTSGVNTDADRDQVLTDYLDLFVAHHPVIRLLAQDPGTLHHPDVGQRARALVFALHTELAGRDAGEQDRVRVGCALAAIASLSNLPPDQVTAARATVLAAARAAIRAVPEDVPAGDPDEAPAPS